MPTDHCPDCDRPHADEWPAPPGTCAVRVTAMREHVCDAQCRRCIVARGTRADCAAHAVDWPARCRALAAALQRYGVHALLCVCAVRDDRRWLPGDEASCTCGLGAALKAGGGT